MNTLGRSLSLLRLLRQVYANKSMWFRIFNRELFCPGLANIVVKIPLEH